MKWFRVLSQIGWVLAALSLLGWQRANRICNKWEVLYEQQRQQHAAEMQKRPVLIWGDNLNPATRIELDRPDECWDIGQEPMPKID